MRYTDITIVGGGLAGSTVAAMLGHAGISAILIDPHTIYPPELRCEKLGGTQIPRLRKTGLADEILRATTVDGEVWEARFGYVVAKKPSDQHGVMYDTLVNTMRAQIPSGVEILHTKVIEVATSDERQRVVLADGEEISARLIVLANGPSVGLHPLDTRVLLGVLERLRGHGATVVIIEHDLDMIANADYVIDLNHGGGAAGGCIVATGTPEEVAAVEASATGRFLKAILTRS